MSTAAAKWRYRLALLVGVTILYIGILVSVGTVAAATPCNAKAVGDLMAAGQWKVALEGAKACADQSEKESPAVGAPLEKNAIVSPFLSVWNALGWRLNVSQLQSITGDYSGAEKSLQAASQWARSYDIDHASFMLDPLAYITVTKGLLFERRGNRNEAIETYRQAALDSHANARIARLLLDTGDRAGARQAASRSDSEPSALAVKAELAALAGDSQGASDLYRRALDYLGPTRGSNTFAPVYFVDRDRISAGAKAIGIAQ